MARAFQIDIRDNVVTALEEIFTGTGTDPGRLCKGAA